MTSNSEGNLMLDLDELTTGADDDVRPLIAEAVQSYRAGAFRACIISTWVAVCTDLVTKLRHLADTGDGLAKSQIELLDGAVTAGDVRKMQDFENSLIDFMSAKLSVLTQRQATELKRLYADRNLCAHPNFMEFGEYFTPTSELARGHLAAAYTSVFSQQPIVGKQIIDFFSSEVQSDSWPRGKDLGPYLQKRFFSRTSESARKNLAKVVIKGCLKVPESVAPIRTAGRHRSAVRAMLEFDPGLVESELKRVLTTWEGSHQLDDESLMRLVGALGYSAVLSNTIPETAKTRLHTLIPRTACETLVKARFFTGGPPSDLSLRTIFIEALNEMGAEDLEKVLAQSPYDTSYLVPRALEIVGEASSFEQAAIRLQLLTALASHLVPDDITSLMRLIIDSPSDQIRPARRVEEELIEIYETTNATEEMSLAWRSLAEALRDESVGKPYYGSVQPPYSELCRVVGI